MTAAYTVRSVARSHIGAVRAVNEDRVFNASERCLWAIADGMGGHAMGDVAAEMVVAGLSGLVDSSQAISLDTIEMALSQANHRVFSLANETGQQSGSTIAGLHLHGDDALVFWAGDSRVYRCRDGQLELLTHDHRLVQEMIDAGVIDTAQARRHPSATVITRAIGASAAFDLASRVDGALPGDVYLLCSDGLSDLIENDALAAIVERHDAATAEKLVQLALSTGGTDNISLVIVSLEALRTPAIDEAECATQI